MIIIDTTALLTLDIFIERDTSEIRLLSLTLVHEIENKLLSSWKQHMLKVSKLSVEKRSLCQQV